MKLVVLVSGNGSNLQSLIDNGYDIKLVISNKKNAYAIKRAEKAGIMVIINEYDKNGDTRESFDARLIYLINTFGFRNTEADFLIVCAGFMRILSQYFTDYFKNKIINLHPALPGMYPGVNAVERAYADKNSINHTGIMCHYVDETLDAGKVICTKKIEILKTDRLIDLKNRVQYYEKEVLMSAIDNLSNENANASENISFYRRGKVRDLYNVGEDKLLLLHSDRVSSFDRDIGVVPGKGHVLADMTSWWFNLTRDIIPNHLIGQKDGYILARKCQQIPIEFVVRGYITGSTKTSLWTHYNNGSRNYCGNELPDGLIKNQKLAKPLLTPTTKGGIGIFKENPDDVPISLPDILEKNILTREQLEYISKKCFELFEFGSKVAAKNDLILVDTKYEFGFDADGNITLIDEVHTCDSSRYWILSYYNNAIQNGKEPNKVDKDTVRDYIKSQVNDPYNDELPEIPSEVSRKVYDTYQWVYNAFSKSPDRLRYSHTVPRNEKELYRVVDNILNNKIVNVFMMCGSPVDSDWRDKIIGEIRECNPEVNFHCITKSAHKFTRDVVEILESHRTSYPLTRYKNIYVTIAGMSNALSGVVACNTNSPVFAIPPFKDLTDMMVNINSTLQMPSRVPAITVLKPINLAMAIQRMLLL